MSVLDELGGLMPSRVWIVAFASLAGSLTPTFCSTGSATEYAAQVTYRNRMVKNAAGRDVVSGGLGNDDGAVNGRRFNEARNRPELSRR